MNKKQHGFTLIELIIVIVILGILAVVAVPKFIDLGTDTRITKLESLEASVRSASNLVHYKAVIEDKTNCSTDPTIIMASETITLRCGYPCPHPNGIANTLIPDAGISWVGGNCSGQLGNIDARLTDAPDPANCKLRYAASRGGSPPSIQLITSGC